MKKRKRGGQPKPPHLRKIRNLTIRLLPQLYDRLEMASRASGRGLSEEVRWRLSLSFMFNTEIQTIAATQKSIREVTLRELMTREEP